MIYIIDMEKVEKNFGKQTRIFDRLFGTLSERVECEQKQGGWIGPQ